MHKRLLSTSASRSLLLRQPCAACGNCVIAAVTWSDVWINHCCCAFYPSHSTVRILPIALYDQGGSGNSPTKLLSCPANSTDLTLTQLNSTQQRTTDAGVWHLYVRIVIIYYHKQTISLYDFFWSVSGTRQVGCEIKLNWLVLPEVI